MRMQRMRKKHEDRDDMLVLARFLSLSVKATPHTKITPIKEKTLKYKLRKICS